MKKRSIIFLTTGIIIISLLIIFIVSNYTAANHINFGFMECLKLDSGECQIKPIDSISLHEYEKYCYYDSTQLWLNRVIVGKNKTYIGMSTRLAPQEYISLMKNDSITNIFFSREYSSNEKLFYAFFLKKYNSYIYRTLYSEPKHGNMILFDIINNDSLSIVKLYNNKPYLSDKLNCD
ncbi:MAG TPA: hypothetical protein PKK00_01415 [Bacteroidales bacterium]|nr:hypothetical protein [Bacteroidales bacterium]HPS16024.1 hypothetical protein [Bacteroidales bacterium]